MEGLTHALGKLADGFSDGSSFSYGIILSYKLLHLGLTSEFFP